MIEYLHSIVNTPHSIVKTVIFQMAEIYEKQVISEKKYKIMEDKFAATRATFTGMSTTVSIAAEEILSLMKKCEDIQSELTSKTFRNDKEIENAHQKIDCEFPVNIETKIFSPYFVTKIVACTNLWRKVR